MGTFRQSADSAEFMNHLVTLHERSQSTCVSQPELAAVINNVYQEKNVNGLHSQEVYREYTLIV